MQKKQFSCLCYILRAIRAGRCRERRYADQVFIQIYFRMHHFVVKNFQNFLRFRRQWGIDPLAKILRTFLVTSKRWPGLRYAVERLCVVATRWRTGLGGVGLIVTGRTDKQ